MTDTTTIHREQPAVSVAAVLAENRKLRVENIQMQATLGYGILAEDERHIIPSNPFKCGTCDTNKKEIARLLVENETLHKWIEQQDEFIERLTAAARRKT